MKKIILTCGVAAMAMGSLCSCSGSGAGSAPKNFPDSIAYYTGQDMGVFCNTTIASMPEDMKAKFDKNEFLAGMKAVLESDTTKQGYMDGLQMGMNVMRNISMLNQAGIPTNTEMMFAQIKDMIMRDSISSADADSIRKIAGNINNRVNEILMKAQQERQMAEMKAQEELGQKNAAAGKEYIDNVKASDKDVKTTESGLTYKVQKQGTGVMPTDKDRVKVIYTGKLIDGTEFDSSKGESREFSVNGVVPGFKEGLKMMNKGSKYTLYIPGNLAYGLQAPPAIGPNSTLVFDVEVVEVIPAK